MLEVFSERKPILRVYAGAMYTGKTFGLIRDLKILDHTQIKYQAFKPSLDDRFGVDKITTRFAAKKTEEPIVSIDAIAIDPRTPRSLLDNLDEQTKIVGLDEAQFFSNEIVDVLLYLKEKGRSIVVSTLDLDFRGEPFGCAPILLAYADQVSKERMSRCMYDGCTNIGTRTQRLLLGEPAPYNDPLVYVEKVRGNPERTYALRCEEHHIVPGKPKFE